MQDSSSPTTPPTDSPDNCSPGPSSRVAVYMRCSSTKQDNESQAHAIKQALQSRDLLTPRIAATIDSASEQRHVATTVDGVGVYADLHVSGRNDHLGRRKGWSAFWNDRAAYSTLIVFNADRIIRHAKRQIAFLLELELLGCRVVQLAGLCKDQDTSDDSPSGSIVQIVLSTLEAVRGQQESEMNSARTKSTFDAIRKANGGVLPFVGAHVIKPDSKSGYRRMTDAQEEEMFWAYMKGDKKADEMGEQFNVPPAYAGRALRRVKERLGYKGPLQWVRKQHGG